MREDTKHLVRSQRLEIYSKELLNRKTLAEIAFERILNELDIKYEAQRVLLNVNAIADYYVPYLNVCFEIDGEYHQFRKEKDRKRTKKIRRIMNMGVIRFSNKDVLNNPEEVKRRINRQLDYKSKAIERMMKDKKDGIKWYQNPVNVNPKLRFSFRMKDTKVNSYIIRRWKNKALKKIKQLSLQTVG